MLQAGKSYTGDIDEGNQCPTPVPHPCNAWGRVEAVNEWELVCHLAGVRLHLFLPYYEMRQH